MTHIITSLCLRDAGCVEVCPVECIVPGKPQEKWPWYYIDPDTCIDCGACIPECPYEAIFPEDEVPSSYTAKGGEYISKVGLTGHYRGHQPSRRGRCARLRQAAQRRRDGRPDGRHQAQLRLLLLRAWLQRPGVIDFPAY